MAKLTIYLPDDLDAAVKTSDIKVSAICQTALSRELERREKLATLADGMTWIVIRDAGRNADVRFTGRKLLAHPDPTGGTWTVYLTQKKKIAVHSPREILDVYENLDELEADSDIAGGDEGEAFMSAVAAVFGQPHILDLDI